jgi:hypothetical protein
MSHRSRTVLLLTLILLLAAAPTFAQRGSAHGSARAPNSYHSGGYSRGSGGYGGYGFGGYSYYPALGAPQTYLPNYWWVSPYPSENPCQAGCNPNAGYEWDSVGTLILNTNPSQARVTLDGIFAGTTDKLGPFQLPVGEHTLHIEAAGYEPTDVVVKFDQPGVQTLDLGLKRLTASAKPAPRF